MINVTNKENSQAVEIKQCANGYIVMVGCKTIVFESLESLITELREYFNNPSQYEKEFHAAHYEDNIPSIVKQLDPMSSM